MINSECRRKIINHLEIEKIHWSGQLSDYDFLSRIYDLTQLPSNDGRFKDAAGDIWQHTVNNFDYQGYWVFHDSRFSLLNGPHTNFLRFISEMVDPLVCQSGELAKKIILIVNDWLSPEGWEFFESSKRGSLPVYSYRQIDNSLVANRYKLGKKLANQGGMGYVVFAEDVQSKNQEVVIKFCKTDSDEDQKKRFAREVRLLGKYNLSGFTIPILDYSLETTTSFFVMPKAESDLSTAAKLSMQVKEKLILRMIDCVEHIHSNGDLHRDIKPENFLVLNNQVYISDLGLAKDPTSTTQFTQSIHIGGTQIYAPPNFFHEGGFKRPSVEDDLFSLGKTVYFIMSGILPVYIHQGQLHTAVFEVIKKATEAEKEKRYKNCSEFRSDLISAFDIIFNRIDLESEFQELKRDLLKLENGKVKKLIEGLKLKDGKDNEIFFSQHSYYLFDKVAQSLDLSESAEDLILIYRGIQAYIQTKNFWPFSYAEKVAKDIKRVFDSPFVSVSAKAAGLEIALEFAINMNRGAAAETCARMIESIEKDDLAMPCLMVLKKFGNDFVFTGCVKLDACKHPQIIKIIGQKISMDNE